MNTARARPWWYLACCAGTALAIAFAYANHFENAFHFDDSHTVEQNLYIRDLKNVPRFFTDPRTFSTLPANQAYRPLVSTTLAIDYRIGKSLQPFWFHVDSFALFLLQCGLLLLLYRRVLGDRWLALFGAALYGLHTANAETVNYVIARTDILSTLGVVATVWLFARAGPARRLHLYLIPAVAGVLAKEQGAMAAPLLFLYVGLIEQQRTLRQLCAPRVLWSALRPTLVAFAACAAIVVLAMYMATTWTPGGSSRLYYALTQPYVTLHYFRLFLLPTPLSADTDWRAVHTLLDGRVALGVTFVGLTLWLAAVAARTRETRPLAFGLLWFFVALLPTSSVVPLAEVMNDHRMYFPVVGLALAAACGAGWAWRRAPAHLRDLPGWRAVPAAVAVLVLATHAWGTHQRNEVWRTEATLWRDVTLKRPRSARGWMNYGLTRMAAGDYAEAERCYERGLALAPQYAYLHVNMAIVKAAQGQHDAAERYFQSGLALMPGAPSLRYYYARWLDEIGRDTEALALLQQAVQAAPADAPSRQLLLQLLAKRQAWPELAAASLDALRIRADDPDALAMLRLAQAPPAAANALAQNTQSPEALLALSLRLYRLGDYTGVIRTCNEALALRPDYAEALNNQCAALNMLARHTEAQRACERALEIKPDLELARNNLAVSRAALR